MVNATAAAVAQMNELTALMTNEQIREAVMLASVEPVTTDARFVRAHLIEEFIRRNGEAAGDALMDEAGL